MLFAWERNISHLDDSWRLGPRTTACFAAGWLVIGALAGLDSAPGSAMVVVPGLMACALVYWVYANRLVDLAMVSLAGLTALCLITLEIGRAHVCTPVTNAHLVYRLLLANKKTYSHILQ